MSMLSAIPAPAVAGCVRERTMPVLKRALKTPVSYHANGKAGVPSRILNPLQGGQIVFCIDRYDEASTMEQLDLRTVRGVVDGTRKLYGGSLCVKRYW